jgi:signal transduction histidine kinase
MVALAVALTAGGSVLAIRQTRSLSARLMAETRRRAEHIAVLATVAASINDARLASESVGAVLGGDPALVVVPAGATDAPWSQPLQGAMSRYAIEPSVAFVREQRATVMTQTVIYLGLTALALASVLSAMWLLTKAVRREMALAELKANFVADVSHELKTPLALIRLFAETLQSGRVADDEKRQEYYAIITRETLRLTNLINNILDFSRIDAGRREFTLQPTTTASGIISRWRGRCRPSMPTATPLHRSSST